MHDGMTYFHYTLQSNQRLIIDLVFSQQFCVVAEIAQKPAQLPHRSGGAVEAASDQAPGEMLGLENSEAEDVKRFLCLPAILRSINPDEE